MGIEVHYGGEVFQVKDTLENREAFSEVFRQAAEGTVDSVSFETDTGVVFFLVGPSLPIAFLLVD
jgi:hypothetical protein